MDRRDGHTHAPHAPRQPTAGRAVAPAVAPPRPEHDRVALPAPGRAPSRLVVARLQRSAGNAAVGRMLAQRSVQRARGGGRSGRTGGGAGGQAAPAGGSPGLAAGAAAGPAVQRKESGGGGCPAPAVEPTPVEPASDPKFAKVAKDAKGAAKVLKKHPPAKAEAAAAGAAAEPPAADKEAQAKEAQADKMAGAKPKGFDKAGFMAAVRAAIAAKAPQNLDEADKFASSGKADGVKAEVMTKVKAGKEGSAKDIADKTAEAPDSSKAKDKPVVPLKEAPPAKPAPLEAAKAMPSKAPASQTDLRAPGCETDAKMAEADVTEDQLAKSNEPELVDAVKAKKEGEAHSAEAPAKAREAEAATLAGAKADAQGAGANALAGMVGTATKGKAGAGKGKEAAKAKDEAARAAVVAEIKKIFDGTKTDVDKILGDLDGAVAKAFEDGEKAAKDAFTADHKARMAKYKDDRYSGALGWARWTGDLFAGLPAAANNLFLESKKLYEQKMDKVISDVADLIGKELQRAKDRIEKGRSEVKAFVAKQPKDLAKVAQSAASEIGDKFSELESEVDSKQDSLVEDLAAKYVEARNAVDEEIKSLQAENKGLWDKAKDAIGGAIETVLKLKDMLLGVLARAAGAVKKIIKDPIGFLGNLVNAVKGGITNFATNILDHLKKGLQNFLFGALGDAGVEIPETFDLKGIIKLILSILGLTWTNIRAKIVKRIGEKAMAAIEQGVEIFQVLVKEGVGGLWKYLLDKLSDLKDTVMTAITDFVVTKVIKAGITWLISMLNPAAAFIKACKMIYDVVMFFVEKGSQIKEFVDSVLDSVESIADGGVGKVAGLIENTLAKMIPLLISFLASLLGLGGIAEKVKEILDKVRKPVSKAVDKVIDGALKLAGPIIRMAKKGIAWAKGKVDKAKGKIKDKLKGKDKISDASAAAAAKEVADSAKALAGKPGAGDQIRAKAVAAGGAHLGGQGTINVSGVPVLQRTKAIVKEEKLPQKGVEEEATPRQAEPKNADQAALILQLIQSEMPKLLSTFHATGAKGNRSKLDKLEQRFLTFMQGKSDRALSAKERRQGLAILTQARSVSRSGYYPDFRDYAWKELRKHKDLQALVKERGSGAKWSPGKDTALNIRCEVIKADGKKVTETRPIDFEHLHRVTDQPFRRHSDPAGGNANLSPMLADANRYYNEGLRNLLKAHMFTSDPIEAFIVQHQLYPGGSKVRIDLEFKAIG
jgi:hypothetical protein